MEICKPDIIFLLISAPSEIAAGSFKNTRSMILWAFDKPPGRAEFYVVSLFDENSDSIVDIVTVNVHYTPLHS